MTLKLKTDIGTFEGETLDEVVRAYKDAKAEMEAEAKRRVAAYDQAIIKAKVEGYNILSCIAEGGAAGRFQHSGIVRPGAFGAPLVLFPSRGEWTVEISDERKATTPSLFEKPVAFAEYCNGQIFAMFTETCSRDIKAYAIGIHEDMAAIAHVPGLTMEMIGGGK